MRIGKFSNQEDAIRFTLNLNCTKCEKSVPGGMLTSKKYFGSYSFFLELDDLKKNYLCGRCRDKKSIDDKNSK